MKVNIGEKPTDPVFGISDLLIHLSADQMEKKAAKVIEGEALDLLIGSIPAEESEDTDIETEQGQQKQRKCIHKNLRSEIILCNSKENMYLI